MAYVPFIIVVDLPLKVISNSSNIRKQVLAEIDKQLSPLTTCDNQFSWSDNTK